MSANKQMLLLAHKLSMGKEITLSQQQLNI